MSYAKAPSDHGEFSGGPGLIDPERRKDRQVTAEEELVELYATNPADPNSEPSTVDLDKRV